ncbi:protocatechuate 3,4-dioxygenase beta subunit [Whalleya microplaca]|nr:protocatechuate 3,4-dioxygenase beta subunit [Whalleya microplaca]
MTSTNDTTKSATNGNLPMAMDLNIDNITKNVISFCSQGRDPRMKFIFERLITHIHDFARETRLSTDEWRTGLDWLEACGQICTKNRKELITVSDIFGLSALVDEIDHPKPPGATEGSILGPFHSTVAEEKANGDQLFHDPNGEPLFVICTVKDTHGNPIPDARIHVWEADSNGEYDVEKSGQNRPDGRGILHSNDQGEFHFDAIIPVPYPILCDGPVGKFLEVSGRHQYRPAHMHFMFEKKGFDQLVTALYFRSSKYCDSDAVFGVKTSLVVDIQDMDIGTVTKYSRPHIKKLLKYEFVLASDTETNMLRDKHSIAALKTTGREAILAGHVPIKP